MTRRLLLLLIGLALSLSILLSAVSCGKTGAAQAKYHCPMHPTVVSDKPGDCPICGMRLVPIEKAGAPTPAPGREAAPPPAATPPPAARKTMYRSTMNPGEVSDKPGQDSMGMEMVPFETEVSPPPEIPGRAPVTITPDHLQHMKLDFGIVEKKSITRQVRTFAKIVPNETRQYRVNTKVEGWVDRLFVDVTGQAVKKGQPLLTLYSPALVASQQELLAALSARDQLGKSPYPSVSQGGQDIVDAARRRLKLWDISDAQIESIEKAGQPQKTMTLYAPASGYVTEKTVLPGQRVMPGDSLFVVADLTTVWADAEIYEADLPYIKVGMPVEVILSYWKGKIFLGKISFLSPSLDPVSRTMRARLEIANPDLALKPEMYGDAYLSYDLGTKTAVPESAVMRTGERTFAFVEKGGALAPVEISLGSKGGGYYEVLSGLRRGDRVVTSANFLLDSESSLKAALQAVAEK